MWGEPQTLKADKILACFQEGVWIGGPKSLVLETCTLILIIFKPSASFYLSPSSHAVVGEEGRVAESWDGWALRFPLPLCPGGEAGREAGGGGSGGGTRPGAAAADRLPPPSPPSSQGERETGPTHVIRRRGTQTLPGVSDLSSRGRGGA